MMRKLLYIGLFLGIFLEIVGLVILFSPKHAPKNSVTVVSTPTPAPTKAAISPTLDELNITLVKGRTTAVPKTDFSLELLNTAQPNPKCPDCGEATTIQASSSAGSKSLSYGCGGLVGCILNQDFENYVISLQKQIDANSVIVAIKPKQ